MSPEDIFNQIQIIYSTCCQYHVKLNDLGNTEVWPDEYLNFYESNAENIPLMVLLKSLVMSAPRYGTPISISVVFSKSSWVLQMFLLISCMSFLSFLEIWTI